MQRHRGRGVRAGRAVQKEVHLRQRREVVLDAELPHAVDERALAQHGHGHPGEDGCLQSADALAHAGDAPLAAGLLQALDRVVAIDVAGRQKRERHGLRAMHVVSLAHHPDELFLPHDLSAGEPRQARDERDVDLAPLHQRNERRRQAAAQFHLDPREGLAEEREHLGQQEGGVEIRRAEDHVALDVGGREPRVEFVVQPQDGARVRQHHPALVGEHGAAAVGDEQHLAREFLEPPHLQRDRGLRATEAARRLGDAAGLDDRQEGAQDAHVDAEEGHGADADADGVAGMPASTFASCVLVRRAWCAAVTVTARCGAGRAFSPAIAGDSSIGVRRENGRQWCVEPDRRHAKVRITLRAAGR